jgi:hypothetical protein
MRITSKLGEFIKFLPVYNYLYNFIQQFLFLGIQDQRDGTMAQQYIWPTIQYFARSTSTTTNDELKYAYTD